MNLFDAFLVSMGINLLMFFPAYFLRTDKLTDISYAVTFVVISGVAFWVGGFSVPSLILFLMILFWAARLGGYLLNRIKKIKRDKRFDGMRESFWRFSRFWLLQGLTVWVVLFPSIYFFKNSPKDISALAYIGVLIWLAGFVIEMVADAQKYKFINNPQNKGKWIDSGIWKYSQHPNYFGEILLWFGVYVYALFGLSVLQAAIGLVGPIYIALLIVYASGIPILRKAAEKRWGSNAEFQKYRRTTSVLIPLPRKEK